MMKRIEWIEELWRNRELVYFFVWRDIKVRYKQTVLGAAWAIIPPFCTMIVFSLLFGKLAKMPSDGIPYPIFSFSALVPWRYFESALGRSGNCLLDHANLITKVYFPRIILVISSALSGFLDFLISSIILVGMMVYYDLQLGWKMILWPFCTALMVFLVLGLGMFFSSLNVKYRDIQYTIPFGIQLLFFISPVIYPTSMIPEKFRSIAAMNPMCGIIEGYRSAFLSSRQIDWQALLISASITIFILVIGLIYFRKTERVFADIV
jgi:lipopolysaccharide transport system permease protein